MPRIAITEQDIKNPDRLRGKLQNAYDQIYKLLQQLEDINKQVDAARFAGLSEVERNILKALTIGSTENVAAGQKPVIPTVDALPPTSTATPGDLVRLSTTGVIYVYVGETQTWVSITAAASSHDILSATHGDSLAAAVVRGDLVIGNATPKWARLARGAGKSGLRVDAAGTDLEWSALAAMEDVANVFTEAQTIRRTTNGAVLLTLGGPNGFELTFFTIHEEFNLSTVGPTTDTAAGFLPTNSELLWMGYRIVTTISGGGVTLFDVGDTVTANRFATAQAGLAAGTSSICFNHRKGNVSTEAAGPTQSGASSARITCNGTPTAGRIRLHHIVMNWTPPTS